MSPDGSSSNRRLEGEPALPDGERLLLFVEVIQQPCHPRLRWSYEIPGKFCLSGVPIKYGGRNPATGRHSGALAEDAWRRAAAAALVGGGCTAALSRKADAAGDHPWRHSSLPRTLSHPPTWTWGGTDAVRCFCIASVPPLPSCLRAAARALGSTGAPPGLAQGLLRPRQASWTAPERACAGHLAAQIWTWGGTDVTSSWSRVRAAPARPSRRGSEVLGRRPEALGTRWVPAPGFSSAPECFGACPRLPPRGPDLSMGRHGRHVVAAPRPCRPRAAVQARQRGPGAAP
nr:hypothetical protein CFP56_79416 [Quercus suber]